VSFAFFVVCFLQIDLGLILCTKLFFFFFFFLFFFMKYEHPKIVYNLNECHVFSGRKIGGQELISALDGWIVTSNAEVSKIYGPQFFILFFLIF
jgi:hypothetical protein